MERSDLSIANEVLNIRDAYQIITGRRADYGKTYCPFGGTFHKDERVFRIFEDTNTAYCYLSCGYLTPVKMIEMGQDLTREDAIQYIFDHTGFKHLTAHERWDEEMAYRPEMDKESLAEALKVYCARTIPDWETSQLEGAVADKLERCLGALRAVRSPEDADKWLRKTKAVMTRVNGA